jgi:hypothetical protein
VKKRDTVDKYRERDKEQFLETYSLLKMVDLKFAQCC